MAKKPTAKTAAAADGAGQQTETTAKARQLTVSAVAAVFRAEDKVRPQWEERLRACREADDDTRHKAADGYLRAVSEELLSTYSDEELQRLYPDKPEPQDIEPYNDF